MLSRGRLRTRGDRGMTPTTDAQHETARFHQSARHAVREARVMLGLAAKTPLASRRFLELHAKDRPVRAMSLVDLGDGALAWRDPPPAAPVPSRAMKELSPAGSVVVDVP